MKNEKRYTVYGDDERVEKEELDELSSEIDDILATNNKKKKSTKTDNRETSRVSLADELNEYNVSKDEDEQEVFEETTNENVDKDSDVAEKKSFPKAAIFAIVAILLAITMVMSAFILKSIPTDSEVDTPSETTTVEPEKTSIPEPTIETTPEIEVTVDPSTLGKLDAINSNKVYSLAETLTFARDINGATKEYLSAATSTVKEKQDDMDGVNVSEKLSENKTLLERDIKTLETYETMFDSYGGKGYLDATKERLNNVLNMYDAVSGSFSSATDLVNKTNEYIRKENELNLTMKDALKTLLDTNSVDYYEENNQIIYDENQVSEG